MCLYVDLLCFSSILKIFFLRSRIDSVYYINITILGRFLVNLFGKHFPPISPLNNFEYGVVHYEGKSIYEHIQCYLTGLLDKIFEKTETLLLREHLKEASYRYLYRLAELKCIIKASQDNDRWCVLVKRDHWAKYWRDEFDDKVIFYRLIFVIGPLIYRKNYFYDKYISKEYYISKFTLFLYSARFLLFCIKRCNIFNQSSKGLNQKTIGVDLIQSKVRLNEINDLYWFSQSQIDPKQVVGFCYEDYDLTSLSELNSLGIQKVSIKDMPMNILVLNAVVKELLKALFSLFLKREESWILFQRHYFNARVLSWQYVYSFYNVRVLWSMYDVDVDKLVKAQAMHNIGGVFAGSHWSNYPMNRVDNQKCYDVLFTWGDHFKKDIFNRYPYQQVHVVGYPLDFYFERYKHAASQLKLQHSGKFIISYHDNVCAPDLLYSVSMQQEIYQMLIELVDKYNHVVLFLKPKKLEYFEKACIDIPRLKELVDKQRIFLFAGIDERRKAVPALIGLASDVAVGLGISTTSAECHFAGVLGLHADLTRFENNAFANRTQGEVLFRDIPGLRKALIDCIEGRKSLNPIDYQQYYQTLDPFMDGKAYQRTGHILKQLLEN